MELGLSGKIVFVTGGSRGIGKAIARAFLDEGAQVAIAARSLNDLDTARKELGDIRTYQGDLTDAEARERIVRSLVDDYGRIDILINNVGGSNGGKAMETELLLFEQAMQLNYLSSVHFSQMASEEMRKTGGGSIINISSIYGRESGGKMTYNNSKAALISFTKAFADEMISEGIRINGIAPGSILHPTGNWQKRLEQNPEQIQKFVEQDIPAGRFGTVEEVANVAKKGYRITNPEEKVLPLTGALKQAGLSGSTSSIVNELNHIGLDVAEQLIEEYPKLMLIGLDALVDLKGRIWIIEANFNPMVSWFADLPDKSIYRRVAAYQKERLYQQNWLRRVRS